MASAGRKEGEGGLRQQLREKIPNGRGANKEPGAKETCLSVDFILVCFSIFYLRIVSYHTKFRSHMFSSFLLDVTFSPAYPSRANIHAFEQILLHI